LTENGLGPVRIGMTPNEVEKIVGPLNISYDASGPDCGEGGPKRPWIPGVGFMFVKGRLARIDISDANGAVTKTEAGVGIGSTAAQAKRAYGRLLKAGPNDYDNEDGRDLLVDGPEPGRAILFESYKGRIQSFRAGLKGPVNFSEGCA
jgi:hypothetical protein